MEINAIINMNAVIEDGCFTLAGTITDHDEVSEDNVYFISRAVVMSGSTISDYTKICAGYILILHKKFYIGFFKIKRSRE